MRQHFHASLLAVWTRTARGDEERDRRILFRYSRAFAREPQTDIEHQLPA